jgi:serine protease Do
MIVSVNARANAQAVRGPAGAVSIPLIGALFLASFLLGALVLHLVQERRATAQGARPLTAAAPNPGGALASGAGAMPAGGGGLDGSGADVFAQRRTAAVIAAERVGPAVVSISVTAIRYVRERPYAQGDDPFNRFFDRFFTDRVYGQEISSLGSGVIIDARGIVVTNEHVVRDAKEIKVSLPDGRTFDGVLVSADRAYDLAVVRIPEESLPVAPVGNSEDLMVGEWAIALGNPFGFLLNSYQPTVTAGVISATNRDIRSEQETDAIYKNMIQTDAAINPGNSGGPLVNALGDVIGINTFIFTTGGGNLGISFAIPINTVVRIVREILEFGRVRQVWIGIRVQEISKMVADYFRIHDRRGLLVWGIDAGSPAARAGIQVGDIIRSVNGESVSRAAEAWRLIFGATIGDEIELDMEREGARRKVKIRLEEAPAK